MAGKLGKRRAKFDGRDFQFSRYSLNVNVPSVFGHANTFKDWGMLGNDRYGDCVFAGFDHEVMNYTNLAAGGVVGQEVVKFTDANALSDYSADTGFDPSKPESDQGTEVRSALKYRQKTGVIDSAGKRHKIGAFVALNFHNLVEVQQALWIFEAVGIGFACPESALTQFDNGKPWSVVKNSSIAGGHYVPLVGKPTPTGELACITWSKRQVLTEDFFSTYCEEAWAYITEEELNKRTQQNWGGFAWAPLKADLEALKA